MTNHLTRAEVYDHLARLEREGHPRPWEVFEAHGPYTKEWHESRDATQLIHRLSQGWPIRLKPQLPPMVEHTIRYPEPVREAPERRQRYYLVNPTNGRYYQGSRWCGGEYDRMVLRRGLIHLTERNAKAHGMALAGCSQDEIDAVLCGEDE